MNKWNFSPLRKPNFSRHREVIDPMYLHPNGNPTAKKLPKKINFSKIDTDARKKSFFYVKLASKTPWNRTWLHGPGMAVNCWLQTQTCYSLHWLRRSGASRAVKHRRCSHLEEIASWRILLQPSCRKRPATQRKLQIDWQKHLTFEKVRYNHQEVTDVRLVSCWKQSSKQEERKRMAVA